MSYIEGFGPGRGRAFYDAATRFQARGKPLVVLKGGRSSAGGRAAASHTGSLAGSDRVFSAAMRQAGISLAESVRSFIDIARLISVQTSRRQGCRVLILTNLGGPGVITADLCVKHGLDVSPASEELQRTLRDRIPPYCAVKNPIDLAGDPAPERYRAILDEVYASAEYDGVVVVAAPLVGEEQVARDLVHAYRASTLPTAVCWMGDLAETSVGSILENGGLPVFEMPEDAVRALAGTLPR
jgi:acyl-CoA synthetase (NDP forming)